MHDSMLGDLRLALRTLIRRPGFSLLVIATLGLGIGANAAMFSVADGLLLREPPFTDPDRLVRITTVRGDEAGGALSVPELDDLRALPVIADAAMYTDQGMYNASGFGTPEELPATITTHNLFRVLGVQPLIGSTFPADFDRSRNFGLVISHGLWTRKFARDPNIVGRTMTLDGSPGYSIFGVMPADFNFPSHSDLFRSSGISANPDYYRRRGARDRVVLARLAPDVTVHQARDALDALAQRLAREFPATNAGVRFDVTTMRDMYSAGARPYVLLLFGAVALVLIVACSNVANLLINRAIARDRETALRTALGAGRWRVIRQSLAESLVFAAGGALVGAFVAVGGVRALTALVPVQLPPWMHVAVDGRVALFLAGIAALTAIVTGLVPALRTSSRAPYAALKEWARGSSEGGQHHRMRDILVVSEVALALVLLVGAGLMLKSVWRLHQVDLGYQTARALTFRVELGWATYGTLEKTLAFHQQVLDRIKALPSVEAVTFDNNLPLSGQPRDPIAIRAAGQGTDDASRNPYVHGHLVGPDYFQVMGIPIRQGRAFDDRDRVETTPVVVVSQRLAERLWPGRDPIGQRIQPQDAAPDAWQTVVGVAAPVLHHELDGAPGFDMYRPFTQTGTAGPYYVIRTSTNPLAIAEAATAIIGDTDPNQSFLDVRTYDTRVANRIWQRRLAGALFVGFAALTIVLAAIGLYGVLSFIVGQQAREFGVRVALGATAGVIISQVLTRGLRLAGAGLAVGLLLAFALARLIGGLLYDVSPADPATFFAVSALLLLVALVACYTPARRATRVDPIVALRAE